MHSVRGFEAKLPKRNWRRGRRSASLSRHTQHLFMWSFFDRYRAEFGARFEAIEFEDADAAPADVPPHSTLTLHLRADGPTAEAADRVIAFFRRRTGA